MKSTTFLRVGACLLICLMGFSFSSSLSHVSNGIVYSTFGDGDPLPLPPNPPPVPPPLR